eukprot:8667311-Pyramimonas_sp.AAC.2
MKIKPHGHAPAPRTPITLPRLSGRRDSQGLSGICADVPVWTRCSFASGPLPVKYLGSLWAKI